MARLTLEQIAGLLGTPESYLAAQGIFPVDDNGNIRYQRDGEWIPMSDVENALANQGQALQYAGVIDASPFQSAQDTGKLAQLGFGSTQDYLRYLYGGGDQVGSNFVLPETQNYLNPTYANEPLLKQEGNDWGFFSDFLGKAALLGGLGYGLNSLMSGGSLFGGAGGSNVGFFDDILGSLTEEQQWAQDLGVLSPDGTIDWAAYDQLDPAGLGNLGADVYGVGDGVANFGGLGIKDIISGVSKFGGLGSGQISNALKQITGSGGDFNLGGLLGGIGDLASSKLGQGLINSAPFLAAINYAQNQNPYDTSKLTSIYDQFNPSAQTFEYDQNTAQGRNRLTSSLQNRGVFGSSFGNADINSFDTMRELGRNSLLNQGLTAKAGIAGQIMNADIASRQQKNELYGRALSGLGSALSPNKTVLSWG